MSRIALIGAGVIARTHAEVLKALPGHNLAAVVDPDLAAARRLASPGVPVFAAVEEMIAAGIAERAHVLVPPPLHAAVARPLLAAGMAVLVEKPMGADAAECAALLANAASSGAVLGVNQNYVHHPAFVRLRRLVESGTLGRPRSVNCIYAMPLRQLQAQQFGHWMFTAPGNILLEQAVHPLSQIVALAGLPSELRTLAEPAIELAPGVAFCPGAGILLGGARLPAELRFAVGRSFPVWQISVTCDDGIATADIQANRMVCQTRGRWLEAADTLFAGLRSGSAIAGESLGNFVAYSRAMLGGARSDPFFRSMRASIAAFHAAADEGRAPELDGHFGANLVQLCETIRDQGFPVPASLPVAAAPPAIAIPDIAILGGTGFIGRHLVQHCLDAGLRVAVLARSTRNLPALFADPRVSLHRGSAGDAEAVGRTIAGARAVINLAHGGGGGSWAEVQAAMVGSAATAARLCRAQRTRLVHVGSIAGLYLGPQPHPVTGVTPPDTQAERRADYARAKAECDRMLLGLHAAEGLDVVILRPGIVVGAGSAPFHSGLGLFNNDQHCIGWNAGRNPLPFVLVGDVAAALLLAAQVPGIAGRCYNLVGDVRPDARTYLAALAEALHRPLRYHPQSVTWLWLEDLGKWAVKRAAGRRVPVPSRRDFLSRGMMARFDCGDARRDLGWQPVAESAAFFRQAVGIYAV